MLTDASSFSNRIVAIPAQVAGRRVIGVVLSGALDDGASGMVALTSRGGVAVVQDPADALYDSMPRHACDAVGSPHVLPAVAIGELLGRLTREELDEDGLVPPVPIDMRMENAMAQMDDDSGGFGEYQVEAELIHEFLRNGARAAAYGSIVAAGANACVLHYRENSAELRKGELMLIDAGC